VSHPNLIEVKYDALIKTFHLLNYPEVASFPTVSFNGSVAFFGRSDFYFQRLEALGSGALQMRNNKKH